MIGTIIVVLGFRRCERVNIDVGILAYRVVGGGAAVGVVRQHLNGPDLITHTRLHAVITQRRVSTNPNPRPPCLRPLRTFKMGTKLERNVFRTSYSKVRVCLSEGIPMYHVPWSRSLGPR
jgi:hypothetical protein